MEENLELVAKKIMLTMYLTLQNYGYSEVSLKSNDLLQYVPKLEELLEKHHMLVSDLFVKTPIEETYDEYKKFLIKQLYERRLGHFNEKYDAIILDCPQFYIYKCQRELEEYRQIIQNGCYFISNDIEFIDDDFVLEFFGLPQAKNKEKKLGLKG